MNYNLYAVFDRVTRRFSLPMAFETFDAAKRQLRAAAASDQMLKLCPQDFDIFLLGHYDSLTGMIDLDLAGEVCNMFDVLSEDHSNEV